MELGVARRIDEPSKNSSAAAKPQVSNTSTNRPVPEFSSPRTRASMVLAARTKLCCLGNGEVSRAAKKVAFQGQRDAQGQDRIAREAVVTNVGFAKEDTIPLVSPHTDPNDSAESQTQFIAKEDLARMRQEIRENCHQRQRVKARKLTQMEGPCLLLLSFRMRRMLECWLQQQPQELDLCHGRSENCNGLGSLALDHDLAQAAAELTFHHNVPPSYVIYFLHDLGKVRPVGKQVYWELLDRMHKELREDPPFGIEWAHHGAGKLTGAVPELSLILPERAHYGVEGPQKDEAVSRRQADDRRPPRSWFGSDDVAGEGTHEFCHALKGDLPIRQHKKEIIEAVRNNQIVLIQGETGCGKTTQVPQYILEALLKDRTRHRQEVRIVVTQPRRIAAITVAKRVAEELGERVGEGMVGYKIRGTTVAGPKCKLLFCTTGVVLRRLANEGKRFMFSSKTVSHLLVDEVHERGVETDFMLTFLKDVQEQRPNLRVILMSATMHTECFLNYFSLSTPVISADGTKQTLTKRPPMVVCPAFCHPVCEIYLESINERLGRANAEAKSPDELRHDVSTFSMSDGEGIDYDLIMQMIEEMECSRDGAWTFAFGREEARTRDPGIGAILVFLPGLGEIQQLMTKLQEVSASASKWWVLPLHANLPPEEQQLCFTTALPPGCTRKIICSTNVAETSVTVPDVTVVIDSCRERRNQVDRHSNTPILKEQWCALDSLKQRRGRAGRVQPGVCFRLLREKDMERLEAVTPPEIQRVPLENVYLQVCASGIDDRPGFLRTTPDPPDAMSVQFAEAALRDLGALDESNGDSLTPLGHHLAALPCHPRLGKILVLGCLLGVPSPCLSICAAMSVRNPMLTTQDTSKRASWQAARMELVESIGVCSDHCVWAHIMQEWRFGEVKQRDLCKRLGLSFERMCASIFERKHLLESLVQVGLLPNNFYNNEWEEKEEMPNWSLVRAAVVGGLYPNIIHAVRQAPRYYSNNAAEKAKWMRYTFWVRQNPDQGHSYPKTLNLHPNSLCFGRDQYHCPWLAFYTIQQTTKLYAYDVSEVNPFALLLFGAEPTYNEHTRQIEVGHCVRFVCPEGRRILPLIVAARASVQQALEKKLVDVKYDLAASTELKVCVQLLRSNGLGFRKLSPSLVARTKKVKGSDEFNEWEGEVSYMVRKDIEHEVKMKEIWAAAKQAAGK